MNARTVGLLAGVVLAAGTSWGQPRQEWARVYGDSGYDFLEEMVQVEDGFVATGVTDSYGSGATDVWLIKIDRDGQLIWSRTFGGADDDGGIDIVATDSGYAIAGYTRSFGAGGYDYWLIGVSSNGDSLWSVTYGMEDDDIGRAIVRLADGGFVIGGQSLAFTLIRTDAQGDSIWTKLYGERFSQTACFTLANTGDGGFAAAGGGRGNGSDFWTARFDANGEELWSRLHGFDTGDEQTYSDEQCFDVIQTYDGGFALAGYMNVEAEQHYVNAWLVRLDANGDSLWSKVFGGNATDVFYSISECDGAGFLLGGASSSYGNQHADIWMVRTDTVGNELWNENILRANWEHGYSFLNLRSDGIMIAGTTDPDRWNNVAGYVVKTTPDPVSVRNPSSPLMPYALSLEPPFPNPFNSTTRITFTSPINREATRLAVFDPLGRRVAELTDGKWKMENGMRHSVVWNANGFPAGGYVIRLEAGAERVERTIILEK